VKNDENRMKCCFLSETRVCAGVLRCVEFLNFWYVVRRFLVPGELFGRSKMTKIGSGVIGVVLYEKQVDAFGFLDEVMFLQMF
jgi:hypothetical protein